MIADHYQRLQALDPRQSFIVQAPAGSGKTSLLTQRFLRLLACVNKPEAILAITFTKKAAAEMRFRIITALEQAKNNYQALNDHEQTTLALAHQALAQDNKYAWQLLNNHQRFNIKTIDAFNTSLNTIIDLSENCLASARIAENPEFLYQEAIKLLLAQLEEQLPWSSAIAELITYFANDIPKLTKALVAMLAKRAQWLPHLLSQSNQQLRQSLANNFATIITAALNKISQNLPKAAGQELLDIAQHAARNLRYTAINSPILLLANLSSLPATSVEDLACWQGLASLLITKQQEWRQRIDNSLGFLAEDKQLKARLKALIASLMSNNELYHALIAINNLPDAQYPEAEWQIVTTLQQVLTIAVAQLRVVFNNHSQIDYPENEFLALAALGNHDDPSDLALTLDYKIQHILVDEFQDTAINQLHLLTKLVAGWQVYEMRTLFIVGDPMQSIYRFRAAEVSLFMRVREQGIGNVKLIPLVLKTNFRAATNLVSWFNAKFPDIFPASNNLSIGAIAYSPSEAISKNNVTDSTVQIYNCGAQSDTMQASVIINIVQETLQARPAETIAILVRARQHLHAIIAAFKQAHLAFSANSIDRLVDKPLIRDLLTLTRAILYPADRTAWLAILRAPYCGLSLNDLLVLSADKRKFIWQAINNPHTANKLSKLGRTIINRVGPILTRAMAQFGHQTLDIIINEAWLLLGGPSCATQDQELLDARNFLQQLAQLTKQTISLHNDVIWNNITLAAKKWYATSNLTGQVQLMTMHMAKGLEFDTVILPHLDKPTRSSEKQLLLWQEHYVANTTPLLLMAPIHSAHENTSNTYNYLRQQENSKNHQENARLFYVAATRAKRSLHLLFNLKLNKQGVIKPATNSILSQVWPAIHYEQQTITPYNHSNHRVHNTVEQCSSHRLVSNWRNHLTIAPSPLVQVCHQLNELHTTQLNIIAVTVSQLILDTLANQGIKWWHKHSIKQQQHYLKQLLLNNGIPVKQVQTYSKLVITAITNTLIDARGLWILQQPQGQTALPITIISAGKPHNIIIDRSFIDSENNHWFINYVIAKPQNDTDIADFLITTQRKYHAKRAIYQQALPSTTTANIRYGLYFPLLPKWCEY